jgi:hypothetical protein
VSLTSSRHSAIKRMHYSVGVSSIGKIANDPPKVGMGRLCMVLLKPKQKLYLQYESPLSESQRAFNPLLSASTLKSSHHFSHIKEFYLILLF